MTSERHARYLDVMGIDIWCERTSQSVPIDQSPPQHCSWQLPAGSLPAWLLNQAVARCENSDAPSSHLTVICDWQADGSQPIGLSREAETLLESMLSAIKLSMQDIAFIELSPEMDAGQLNVATSISASAVKAVLFMGALPADVAVADFHARGVPNQTCNGIPLITSIHPNYLLANPTAKRDAWEDLKQVRSILEKE